MGHRSGPLRVLVLHNADFHDCDPSAHDFESRADVANAAAGIAAALASRGHLASVRGVDEHDLPSLIEELRADPPDLVFNLCESLAGQSRHELVIPALLDLAGVPYTGSGPVGIALALRKDRAKEILRARGVSTPEARLSRDGDVRHIDLPFPLIVKPTSEDASVGIHASSVVHDRGGLALAVARVVEELRQPALVERYVEGRELYVSLLGNSPPVALPFHEIDFSTLPRELPRIVSYRGKWVTDSEEYRGTRPIRCLLDEDVRAAVESAARDAFAALDLADYARVDVRLATDGTPYVIDVNPNCDLSDGAGFSRAAGFGGLEYPQLVERVCRVALERTAHVDASAGARPSLHAVHPTAVDVGSAAAGGADLARRAVQLGGGEGRARADRRRAR